MIFRHYLRMGKLIKPVIQRFWRKYPLLRRYVKKWYLRGYNFVFNWYFKKIQKVELSSPLNNPAKSDLRF